MGWLAPHIPGELREIYFPLLFSRYLKRNHLHGLIIMITHAYISQNRGHRNKGHEPENKKKQLLSAVHGKEKEIKNRIERKKGHVLKDLGGWQKNIKASAEMTSHLYLRLRCKYNFLPTSPHCLLQSCLELSTGSFYVLLSPGSPKHLRCYSTPWANKAAIGA